jgi:four helix bundle protein
MQISSATELIVYKKANSLATRIFEISKSFPAEERYSLTDQIRRSSRSVCSNLREAWAKRAYPAHFTSKLSDCDGENGETDTWLDFARDGGYLTDQQHFELKALCGEVGKMLGAMIKDPSGFVLTTDR